jgi:hypothetical protein
MAQGPVDLSLSVGELAALGRFENVRKSKKERIKSLALKPASRSKPIEDFSESSPSSSPTTPPKLMLRRSNSIRDKKRTTLVNVDAKISKKETVFVVIMIGWSGVGRTALFNRIVANKFEDLAFAGEKNEVSSVFDYKAIGTPHSFVSILPSFPF